MVRLLDEPFKETGFSESWSEVVGVGNTFNENFPVSSFTAGTPAPSTLGKYCANIITQTASSNAYLQYTFTTSVSTLYIRMEVCVVSANLSNSSSSNSILQIINSLGGTLHRARFTDAASFRFVPGINASNAFTSITQLSASLNYWYTYEVFWDRIGENYIDRINGTVLNTIKITAIGSKDIKTLRFGDNAQSSGSFTFYFDNIRVNDNTGDNNNSWPGTSYDEPLREVEFLSTQRFIGMSL